jgi:hypothetical protein
MATVRLSVEDFESGNVPHVCAWSGDYPEQWQLVRGRDCAGWLPATSSEARRHRSSTPWTLPAPYRGWVLALVALQIVAILMRDGDERPGWWWVQVLGLVAMIGVRVVGERRKPVRAAKVDGIVVLDDVHDAFAAALEQRTEA